MKKITKAMSVFLALLMAMSAISFNVSAEEVECEHNFEKVVIEPTCVQAGCIKLECPECGESYKVEDLAALGHTYGDWITTEEETCFKNGTKYRECTVCDSSVKDHIEIEIIETRGHSFDEGVVTEATCGQAGYTTYTCGKCGEVEVKDEKPALEHKYGEWEIAVEATCTSDGAKTRKCLLCDEKIEGHIETEVIPATGHNVEFVKVVAPTYTEQGYTLYECSGCGMTENRDFTPVLPPEVLAVELGEKIVVNYEQKTTLEPVITMGGSATYTVTYSSAAENVATVDSDGNIIGKGMGKTVITCTVIDANGNTVTDTVDVQVKFTFMNWLTIIRQILQAAIDIVIGGILGGLKK